MTGAISVIVAWYVGVSSEACSSSISESILLVILLVPSGTFSGFIVVVLLYIELVTVSYLVNVGEGSRLFFLPEEPGELSRCYSLMLELGSGSVIIMIL